MAFFSFLAELLSFFFLLLALLAALMLLLRRRRRRRPPAADLSRDTRPVSDLRLRCSASSRWKKKKEKIKRLFNASGHWKEGHSNSPSSSFSYSNDSFFSTQEREGSPSLSLSPQTDNVTQPALVSLGAGAHHRCSEDGVETWVALRSSYHYTYNILRRNFCEKKTPLMSNQSLNLR